MNHIKHGEGYFTNGYKVLSGFEQFEQLDDFPSFSSKFPWFGGDLQTIASQIRPNKTKRLDLGERCELALNGDGEALMARFNKGMAEKPTIIMLHGLGGDEDSIYMREATCFFNGHGFNILRVNLRGSGASAKTSHNIYHAGISEDLRAIIEHLPKEFSDRGVILMGFSLGANVMLKYLGEAEAHKNVLASVSVSAPIDLKITQNRIAELRNRLYRRYLLKKLKRDFANISWNGAVPPLTEVEHLTSIIEFDDKIIAPVYGFEDACDYYEKSSSKPFINNITSPTLIIHGATDPWILPVQYEDISWSDNKHVCTILTEDGGHVGFNASGFEYPWHLHAAAVYISSIVN